MEPTYQECHYRTLTKTLYENVVFHAVNTLLDDKSTYNTQLEQNFAKVIRDAQISRINNLQDYIKKQSITLTDFDKALVKRRLK